MKITLELSDFDEHGGPPEILAEKIKRAIDFGFTIEVMKVPSHSPWHSEAKFVDVGNQTAHRLIGPIEVELAEPTKDTNRNRTKD